MLREEILKRTRGLRTEPGGHFTLDTDQALHKLAAYRFQDPYFYILKLLQAASRLGAENVRLRVGASKVELVCDGEVPRETNLERLKPYLLERGDPTLTVLAAALVGAGSLEPARLQLTAGPGGRGFHFKLRHSATIARARFWSRATQYHMLALWQSHPDTFENELRAIHKRCRFHPARITINGLPMGEETSRWDTRWGESEWKARLAWREGASKVWFVDHGVVMLETEHAVADLQVVINAAQLSRDLSGMELVRDRAFMEIFEWIERVGREVAEPSPPAPSLRAPTSPGSAASAS